MAERINAGPIGEHIDQMRPSVVRSLVLNTGQKVEGIDRASDDLWGYWNGNGVEKVMVEGAVCARCGTVMQTMTVRSAVGPEGFNTEPGGRMTAARQRPFPFVVPRALAEAGASCACGGRLNLTTRTLHAGEDW